VYVQVLFIFGLYQTSPSIAAIFQPLIPVFAFVISLLLGMETLSVMSWLGMSKLVGIVTSAGG